MELYDRKIRSLPELIAALEECDGGGDKCAACAYNEVGDGCGNVVEMDALFWLKELSSHNRRMEDMWADAMRKLKVARAERDLARGLVARITGERESAWLSGSQTNYQKIKNMGPLHFADWLMRTLVPCLCCDKQGVCGIPEDEVNDEYCAEHILLWLMQEVDDAEGN